MNSSDIAGIVRSSHLTLNNPSSAITNLLTDSRKLTESEGTLFLQYVPNVVMVAVISMIYIIMVSAIS